MGGGSYPSTISSASLLISGLVSMCVSLHRDGEPLLNKRFEAHINHLTDLGVYVTVSQLLSHYRSTCKVPYRSAGLRMVDTDFCPDGVVYERLRVKGVSAPSTKDRNFFFSGA